ncbi:3035_t:CDS:1, partial [Cetraspora pellucida]
SLLHHIVSAANLNRTLDQKPRNLSPFISHRKYGPFDLSLVRNPKSQNLEH